MQSIAFFTPGLKIGGIERVFITYAEALLHLGYEVSYVICKDDGILLSSLPSKLTIVSLGNRKLRNSIFPLYRFFKKSQVDVFICGGDVSNALSIILSKLARSKTKVIVSHHNYFNIEQKHVLSTLIIKFLYNKASTVLSVSDGITDMLVRLGVKRQKIRTIYNPVDIAGIQQSAALDPHLALPGKYLLFIGRLYEVKNLPFLMEAFRLVNQKDASLELVILGEGAIKESLVKKVEELELTDKIHFIEPVSNPFPILKMSEAVVLPSFSEALPTVILESFVLGKTVIATPTNGAIDLLEQGRLGYLSDTFDNVEAFASVIEKGLKHPISVNALESKVKTFDIGLKVHEIEQLF